MIRYLLSQIRAMAFIFLLALVPFGFLFYYVDINVETALMQRRLRTLQHEKELLEKKNKTMREKITSQLRKQEGISGSAARFSQNKIVRIKLGSEEELSKDD